MNDYRDRRSDRFRVPYTGYNFSAIRLDLHATAAAKALLTTPKLVIQSIDGNWNSCWKTRQRCHQTFAVGLARSFKA